MHRELRALSLLCMCEVVSQFILRHLSPCTLLGDTCHVLVLYICRSESQLFVLVFASFNKHLYSTWCQKRDPEDGYTSNNDSGTDLGTGSRVGLMFAPTMVYLESEVERIRDKDKIER